MSTSDTTRRRHQNALYWTQRFHRFSAHVLCVRVPTSYAAVLLAPLLACQSAPVGGEKEMRCVGGLPGMSLDILAHLLPAPPPMKKGTVSEQDSLPFLAVLLCRYAAKPRRRDRGGGGGWTPDAESESAAERRATQSRAGPTEP